MLTTHGCCGFNTATELALYSLLIVLIVVIQATITKITVCNLKKKC